ncbi:MAG TPA: SPOR domain-containing protein [Steroidobacteraceae bacterium]|nr:SPOR domain-containing protein [Steroidobacteraceae bacterium]
MVSQISAAQGAASAGPAADASPWVINLRAAMTPLRAETAPVAGLEHLRIYDIASDEEGRPRHRLRVGFFASRADAESAIAVIRRDYPAAFATLAIREDLARLGDFQWQVPTAAEAVAADDAAQLNSADLDSGAVLTLLEAGDEPARGSIQRADSGSAPPVAPAELRLVTESPASGVIDVPPQAATPEEQADWFALELVMSTQPLDASALPSLDIFALYSLYSVAGVQGSDQRHSIRLGFFRERISASQVASYVRYAFPDVKIVPVAAGERATHCATQTSSEDTHAITSVELQAPQSNVIELARSRPQTSNAGSRPAGLGQPTGTPRTLATAAASRNGNGATAFDPSRSGKHKTLGELLVEEARQVALSETAIRRMPPHKQTLFNKLVSRLKR